MKQIIILLFVLSLTTCSIESKKQPFQEAPQGAKLRLKHAVNFNVTMQGTHKIVEIKTPYSGTTHSIKYRLIPKDEKITGRYDEKIIRVPIERFVCTSTTHLAPLEMLNLSDKLIGFPSTQYISSEQIRNQVENGQTIELGMDNNLNMELLLELSPDLVMNYSMTGKHKETELLDAAKIPSVLNAEFLEKTPLGRAEWIKFIGLFFNKEQEADSIFTIIETQYLETKNLVDHNSIMPSIMSGTVYEDTWYVPGGQSWAAKFFRDAGGNYLWKEDDNTGSIPLSFEAVYEKANNAKYWLGAANYYSIKELKAVDDRYCNFTSYKNGDVYTYNARAIQNGGNDYFESGFSRPDIILKDLVKIIHPNLLPEYELYYFRKLDE